MKNPNTNTTPTTRVLIEPCGIEIIGGNGVVGDDKVVLIEPCGIEIVNALFKYGHGNLCFNRALWD